MPVAITSTSAGDYQRASADQKRTLLCRKRTGEQDFRAERRHDSCWRAASYALSVVFAIVAAAPVDDRMRDQSIAVEIVRYASKADERRYRKTRCFSLTWATRLPRTNGARA